ncbi:MAG TPA: cellulose synthase operon protein YhjQ/BcsQ [Phenylobacterium sp.]|uniref:cellulose synthase operon protein YhjQ/BcsQ n=1 Tax=Phenylobacterium sp. TaxID=1871053 RepID=UPI002B4669F9|nr:cellulose synthase operon protein YhjQ/BcsQ [Phenylobacterium sp.]HKR87167.1 cellulose synthase operon protein YhjQ/BcsQ [Phenylobacterium sp.]
MTIIAVRSAKGGVGRTSVTALLAAALARRGLDVAVMDLDRQDALRLMCGDATARAGSLESSRLELAPTPAGFARVTQDAATCALLMGGGPNAGRLAPGLVGRWLGASEVLIVDMPAVEDAAAAAVGALAGLHLRLFLPDVGSLAVLEEPSQDEAFSRSVYVLNQADRRRPLTDGVLGFLRHVAGARFGGEIRRDEAVPEAFASLTRLADYAPASAAWEDVQSLAAELELRLGAAARFETSHIDASSGEARRA